MARIFLDLEIHEPNAASPSGGGWIIPKLFTQSVGSRPHISPHCENLAELEWQIDRMQADLEEIRKLARRKFETFDDDQAAARQSDALRHHRKAIGSKTLAARAGQAPQADSESSGGQAQPSELTESGFALDWDRFWGRFVAGQPNRRQLS